MDGIRTIYFKGCRIRYVNVPEPWYCGRDLGNVLGYKEGCHRPAIRRIKAPHKRPLRELVEGVPDGNATYISKQGFEILVSKCKHVAAVDVIPDLINEFKLNVNVVSYTKEQIFLDCIMKALPSLYPKTQYHIGKYKIDLYFEKERIAVECDEFGHSSRFPEDERTRQEYIENALSCKFVRFNPDAPDFNIFKTIGEITSLILRS